MRVRAPSPVGTCPCRAFHLEQAEPGLQMHCDRCLSRSCLMELHLNCSSSQAVAPSLSAFRSPQRGQTSVSLLDSETMKLGSMKMRRRRCCRLGRVHSSMCLQRLAVSEAKAALQEHHGQHECWDSQTAMSQLAVSILQKSQMAATPKKRYWQAVPRSTDEQDDLVCSCSRHTSVDCRTAARMLPYGQAKCSRAIEMSLSHTES